jgi:hypothetical protein
MIEFTRANDEVPRPLKDPNGEPLDQRKQLVCGESWVRMVDEWCKRQPGRAPTFSEAVRILVERQIRDEERSNGKP